MRRRQPASASALSTCILDPMKGDETEVGEELDEVKEAVFAEGDVDDVAIVVDVDDAVDVAGIFFLKLLLLHLSCSGR